MDVEWEYVDSFSSDLADNVDKLMELLNEDAPEMQWRTFWHDHEDLNGNPLSYIAIYVPLEKAEEAILIYEELKDEYRDLFN